MDHSANRHPLYLRHDDEECDTEEPQGTTDAGEEGVIDLAANHRRDGRSWKTYEVGEWTPEIAVRDQAPLLSAYASVGGFCFLVVFLYLDCVLTIAKVNGGREPELTNYAATGLFGAFVGCLDYLLLSPGLVPLSTLPLPSLADLAPGGSLPTDAEPSDHLMLGATFEVQHLGALSSPQKPKNK